MTQPTQDDLPTDGTLNDNNTPRMGEKNLGIKYSIEYRHRETGDLIHREVADSFTTEFRDTDSPDHPIFEVVTIYKTKPMDSEGLKKVAHLAPSVMTAPSYKLRIYSPAIINALQSVVQYYPAQDLTGEVIDVHWPYPVLVHHYDQLSAFRDACAVKEPSAMCVRERNASDHLNLLLQFLDEHIMEEVRVEKERYKRGFHTWEHLWLLWEPGMTILINMLNSKDWPARVVHSISGGIFENPPVDWTVTSWNLRYDGTYLGRVLETHHELKFDGEKEMGGTIKCVREIDDLKDPANLDEVVARQLEYGKKYWDLLQKQCKYYKGKSREFPFNDVDGLVMVDLKSYFSRYDIPIQISSVDCRNWISDCICAICKERKAGSTGKQITPLFDEFNHIPVEDNDELSPHMYLLCDFEMMAFVFNTRRWEKLHVDNFFEPKFEENMIDHLVMDEQRKRILKGLAKSFARRNKNEEVVPTDLWAADFVKGKGSGLIFLLHGKPGVGKTCTAECIAAFTRQPLMVLTASDIGTNPGTVESNLTVHFRIAQSWSAVVLIDEADVFMERRSTTDLVRNGLVAGFLRALEYYHGILFLTTNRVGAFDDAFVSRVHVQLYYPDFTDDQRQQVWQTFIDKLARERRNYMRLNIDAKEYIRGAEMRSVKWNGREIRNAFQTAVALAEYDDEKDEEGKIVLTDAHFRAVLELSKDFKNYLHDLHKGSEGKRAERKYERLDTYSKAPATN